MLKLQSLQLNYLFYLINDKSFSRTINFHGYNLERQESDIKEVTEITKEKRIYLRISEKMFDELNEVLKETEQNRSEVLRNCLREYINKNKKSK